jgi:mevalonate kinase
VEGYRRSEDYAAIRALGFQEYFAASQYILASVFEDALPVALDIEWESEIPASSGLGSGGAAFTALVTALVPFHPRKPNPEERADAAHRGDIIAHGGIASGLDTQTSLFGGVIRYIGHGLAETIPWHESLMLVIGDTGVFAATSEVNGRVRSWLSQNPDARMAYFRTIGALERAALPMLRRGDWAELGSLLNLNQLALEKIGVSCPESENLIEAALGAGAYGAKVSGSGGGGIIVALVSPETRDAVAQAISQAGGTALIPEIGVDGAEITKNIL